MPTPAPTPVPTPDPNAPTLVYVQIFYPFASSYGLYYEARPPTQYGAGITNYQLSWRLKGETDWTESKLLEGTSRYTQSVTGASFTPDETYEFRIRGRKSANQWTPWSNILDVVAPPYKSSTTVAPMTPTPAGTPTPTATARPRASGTSGRSPAINPTPTTRPRTTTDRESTYTTPSTSPVINSFTASRSRIDPGETATLTWRTTNATSVTISGISGGLSLRRQHDRPSLPNHHLHPHRQGLRQIGHQERNGYRFRYGDGNGSRQQLHRQPDYDRRGQQRGARVDDDRRRNPHHHRGRDDRHVGHTCRQCCRSAYHDHHLHADRHRRERNAAGGQNRHDYRHPQGHRPQLRFHRDQRRYSRGRHLRGRVRQPSPGRRATQRPSSSTTGSRCPPRAAPLQ